ncbi:S26 family signal peptidase [Dactylosporangium sp. NPDC051485]|uniref:S26 family signal peptidase n=1 Tax=Dactylosporangium sp. NPDC051485 TaxID=3154846 RepID=UPI003412875E
MWTVVLVAAAAVVLAALWWARRNLVLVRVEGPSMLPTLADGAQVLARRTRHAATGRLVLLAPPAQPGAVRQSDPGRLWFVKRLVATAGEPVPPGLAGWASLAAHPTVPPGFLVVTGDNPDESYDSRQEGPIPATRLRAVVLRSL